MTPGFLHALEQPEIESRVRSVLAGAVVVGAGVLILRTALPRKAPVRAALLPAAQSGAAYLMLGLVSRLVVQHHRSRLQIAVLLVAVACAEAARHRRGGTGAPWVASWIAGSLAVCIGVVAAKWALEPGALTDALGSLQADERTA